MVRKFKKVFKEGDLVKCKSYGPLMTVEGYNKKGVECVWFGGSEVKRGLFNQDTLVKEKENRE
jgi:uncharacterized protein YodC (DUF2158 family)